VKDGEWDDAWRYVRPFSPLWEPPEGEGTNQQYTDFLHSLEHNSILEYVACRGEEGGRAARSLFWSNDDAFRKKSPEMAQRHDLYRSMTSERARYLIKSIAKHTSVVKMNQGFREIIYCLAHFDFPQTRTSSDANDFPGWYGFG